MRRTRSSLIAAALLAGLATPGLAGDAASRLAGLATACPHESVGLVRRTQALTIEDGVLKATQTLLFKGDSAFGAPETLTLPLSRARFAIAGSDLYGRPQIALTCPRDAFCIGVSAADGSAKQNTGVIFLTGCDKAAGKEMLSLLRRLR